MLLAWSMRVNAYFSSTMRIQPDQGQRVVQDGPYRFVRHPGYLCGILLAPGLSLALGSLWGLLPAGGVILALLVRTQLEDVTLQHGNTPSGCISGFYLACGDKKGGGVGETMRCYCWGFEEQIRGKLASIGLQLFILGG
ncbi:MAG: methyltransferase family protein [Bacillota bacterium]|jgi:hypothetical protein